MEILLERSQIFQDPVRRKGLKAHRASHSRAGQREAHRTWALLEDKTPNLFLWLLSDSKHWFTPPGGHRVAVTPVQPPELPGRLQGTIHPCTPVLSPESPLPALPADELELICSAFSYSLDYPTQILQYGSNLTQKILLECVQMHPWRHRAGNVAPQPHTRAQLSQTLV